MPRKPAVLLIASFAALAVLVPATPALADPEVRSFYVPVGVNLGATILNGSALFAVGAEASVVTTQGSAGFASMWLGGYVDTVINPGNHAIGRPTLARLSVGPEFGFGPLGVDAGYLLQVGNGVSHGVTVRALLTVAYVALYARAGIFLGKPDLVSMTEFGVLLKYPFELGGKVVPH